MPTGAMPLQGCFDDITFIPISEFRFNACWYFAMLPKTIN
jgi:hypothetical protein